ncbi:uncharacterized protein LOC117646936 [Thrips palmi]|uniref:Uncharacterized protein LOC117646936 n=1 Tax=Thrips palmi TaxID=161013 RepID=A0A6P8Z2H2_THRPL|nr:uncharacterized protein LOC117646936 [Thrips palmi]
MAVSAGWRRVLLMLLLVGMVRAGYHFIRLALLAAMGLAGMYMLHMLAQDYNKITNRPRPAVAATRALFRAITKRDVSAVSDERGAVEAPSRRGVMAHLLRQVLMQDPLGCARKLVCQLSASTKGLRPHETAILRLVQRSEEDDDDEAAAEFRAAEQLGQSSKDAAKCAARYSKCLIEARAFLKLLQAAGTR